MAEPIKDYISKHVFDAKGFTGDTYYYRITSRDKTLIWDNAAKVLKAPGDLTYLEGVIPLVETEDSTGAKLGVFRIILFKELPGGTYNITIHKQEDAVAVPSDDIVEHSQQKHGSIFGF